MIFRSVRRRKRIPILVAVEIGQHHSVSVLVQFERKHKHHRTDERAVEEDHVCDRAVLYHVVHDQRGFRQRGVGDGQREDIYHMYDGHRV